MNKKIIQTYAKILALMIWKNKKYAERSEKISYHELFFLCTLLRLSKTINSQLKNSLVLEKQKSAMLFKVLPKLSFYMRTFLLILEEKKLLFLLPEITLETKNIVLEKKLGTIQITVSNYLSQTFLATFLQKFNKLLNYKNLRIKLRFSKSMIAGCEISYNSFLYNINFRSNMLKFFGQRHNI